MNYYEILELERNASLTDIKKAYKRLALLYHPDKNPGVDTNEHFMKISTAYQVLSNEKTRDKYDLYGETVIDYDLKTPDELFKELFSKFDPEISNFLNNTFSSLTKSLNTQEKYDGFWGFINKVNTSKIIEEGTDVLKNVLSKKLNTTINNKIKQNNESNLDIIKYIYTLNLDLLSIQPADEGMNEIPLDYDFLRKYTYIKLSIKDSDYNINHQYLLDLEYDLHSIKINDIDYDFLIEYKFPNSLKKYKNNNLLLELPLSYKNSIKPFHLKYKLSKQTTLDFNVNLDGQSNLLILDDYGILDSAFRIGKLYIIFKFNDDTIVNNYNENMKDIKEGIKTIDLIGNLGFL
jgi:curved DNA-binding protein CbpA